LLGLQEGLNATPAICKTDYNIKDYRLKESAKRLERLLERDPSNVDCMLKLASLYLRDDMVSKGFDLIAKAYDSDPTTVLKSNISKVLDLALRLSRLKYLAKRDKDSSLWKELGNTYFDMGIFKDAAEAFEESLKIRSDDVDVMILLALSYGNQNRMQQSVELLKRAVKEDPYNFYANYYYGKVLKNELGREKEGMSYLMMADFLLKYHNPKFKTSQEKRFIKRDLFNELTKK
jgi:cytochrome c-type biogenesis protein CcmH/NrfG